MHHTGHFDSRKVKSRKNLWMQPFAGLAVTIRRAVEATAALAERGAVARP
jgi:hypothetical protein